MLDAPPVGHLRDSSIQQIWNSDAMQQLRSLHAAGRAAEIDMCRRCRAPIPHPLLVAGSLLLHSRAVRRWLPSVERLVYFSKLPARLLWARQPGQKAAQGGQHLVQLDGVTKNAERTGQ